MWLSRRSESASTIRMALPDALDLLVVCIEAGLGLDQAFMRVSQELRITHPELCGELDLVNAQIRMGRTRIEALRELASRTGVDDIKALVAMLIQTDRFGTSVSQSLRVHSDDMRMKRRQRAEEMAAKTPVKMVPPLVFFIFPALFVVILGPAMITIYRQFSECIIREILTIKGDELKEKRLVQIKLNQSGGEKHGRYNHSNNCWNRSSYRAVHHHLASQTAGISRLVATPLA